MINQPYIPALATVSQHLSPLERAYQLLARASDQGFKWPNAQFVLGKINEELAETEEAIISNNKTHAAEEIGDVLSATVNLARFTGVNVHLLSLTPHSSDATQAITQAKSALDQTKKALETGENEITQHLQVVLSAIASLAHSIGLSPAECLAETNRKFVTRFNAVEKILHSQGRTMATTPLKEMIGIWNQQKDSRERI